MANDGILRTHDLDDVIKHATDGETIGENMQRLKDELHRHLNMISPQAQAEAADDAQRAAMPAPATKFTHERELKFAPESGRRSLILRAMSEADLDALEASILGY